MFNFNLKNKNLPKKDLRPLGLKSRRKQTEPNSVQRGLLNISKIATNPKLAHPSVLYIHCPENIPNLTIKTEPVSWLEQMQQYSICWVSWPDMWKQKPNIRCSRDRLGFYAEFQIIFGTVWGGGEHEQMINVSLWEGVTRLQGGINDHTSPASSS